MSDVLNVWKIEKYDEMINKRKIKIFDNVKMLSLFGLLIFLSAKNGLETEMEELVVGGSTVFGTINLISMVKSICSIYQLNEIKENLKNENRQK